MRKLHLFLVLSGVAIVAAFALVLGALQRSLVDTPPNAMPATAQGQVASLQPIELVIPRGRGDHSPREAAPAPEAVAEDPCASIMAELQATLADKAAAEKEVHELRDVVNRLHGDLSRLRVELDRRPVPTDTPYGAFLASPEAAKITDPQLRLAFRAVLDQFPVMLQPGEATWILDHTKMESGSYDYPNDEDLVYFLGVQRLAEEIPLDWLYEKFLWHERYGLRLQAALPPAKRAELQAKLQALMARATDPEDIEWLLQTFPTFFN